MSNEREAARVVLASGSPRRTQLLTDAGIAHEIRVTDVDESVLGDESPHAYVERLAIDKARAANGRAHELVIGADTCVVLDGAILGKPRDRADAVRMLHSISGRTHTVHTGLALLHDTQLASCVETSHVTLATLDARTIAAYVDTGEPDDKAGAYALQGIGGLFVTGVDGSASNVIGMPLHQIRLLAASLGIHLGP